MGMVKRSGTRNSSVSMRFLSPPGSDSTQAKGKTMHFTRLLLACVLVGGVALQISLVTAQEKAPQKAGAEERRGLLPFYFGKLAVSDDQRDKLYALQGEYEKKLESLRAEIKRTEQERDRKMEELLTPGQKLRLQELREEAKRRGEKDPDAKPEPKPQKEST